MTSTMPDSVLISDRIRRVPTSTRDPWLGQLMESMIASSSDGFPPIEWAGFKPAAELANGSGAFAEAEPSGWSPKPRP
jgi:hypothetical protein